MGFGISGAEPTDSVTTALDFMGYLNGKSLSIY
jgi:hypothetical protein